MPTDEVTVQNHSASYYEVRYTGYGLRYHTQLIQWMMRGVRGKILDVGCGTGIISRLYPAQDILGIDLAPEMLARHLGRHQLMNVCAMPQEWTGVFDTVICRSLLHHLPDHWRGLAEMQRILKPGGRIIFLETNKSWLATKVRAWKQRSDRFSEYHHAFKDQELLADIRKWFLIDEVRYLGYLAYPLFGFPDIARLDRLIPLKPVLYPLLMGVDTCLSRLPWLNRLSWALGVKAHKLSV